MARRLADSIWLRPEPKGRQPTLSRSRIAAAALAIADAEGFAQATLRLVAARLRAATMTLHHYVREAISAIARRTRAVFSQHSWALVSMQLAPPGPHAMEHFEQCLEALADAPLEPTEKLVLLGSLDDLAFGSALRKGDASRRGSVNHAARPAVRTLGEQMLATGRFPHMSALFEGRSDKQSAALFTSTTEDERFELGLAAILDRFEPAQPRTGRRANDHIRKSGKRRPRS